MARLQKLEEHARRFLEPELSMQMRYELAKEVQDGLEIVYTRDYHNFLTSHFRVLSSFLLQHIEPQAPENSVEQKLRNVIIEILSRLPHNQVLQPYVKDLIQVAMHVLRTDNEENGLVCMRIVRDLHRSFNKDILEPEVQPFLDFVQTIYQNFRATVDYFFNDSSGNDSPQRLAGGPTAGQLNPRSTMSIKILIECASITMLLLKKYEHTNVTVLLPLMVDAISIPDPQHISPRLKNHYVDLKSAHVKTISLLTYLLGSYVDSIRPYEESISKSIVNLLVTCPDSALIREELLHAIGDVLKTDLRRGFFPLIDTLLVERVLVGTDRACFRTLRPLAYSNLAKIIYHVRWEISFNQVKNISLH